ncbi:hypothetical protein JCM9533A_64580 [Catenuloplanes niger JCM 9533]
MTLAELNALPDDRARAELRTCGASSRWAAEVAARRPYPRLDALLHVSDAALAVLGWSDVLEALAAHPRIGQRVTGGDRESAWSRREQSGMDTAPEDVRAALAEANAAYEGTLRARVPDLRERPVRRGRCWPRRGSGSATTRRPSAAWCTAN